MTELYGLPDFLLRSSGSCPSFELRLILLESCSNVPSNVNFDLERFSEYSGHLR